MPYYGLEGGGYVQIPREISDLLDANEKRIAELEEDIDARRRAITQEIAQTLRQRGYWVPADTNSSDLIVAVGLALDRSAEGHSAGGENG